VPPHPVAEAAPTLELEAGTTEGAVAESGETGAQAEIQDDVQVPAAQGEVRGEPRRFPHIQPPASGETIAAAKPFRGRSAETGAETVTESGAEPTHVADLPVVVVDEGRIGTEVQPGVSVQDKLRNKAESEREAHHA
jgi:hypothetical protein